MARLLFARMRADVNRFVDTVYAPHQVRAAMERQVELARSDDEEARRKSLLLAIVEAFQPGAPADLQDKVLRGMEFLVSSVRADVESMRRELLDPLAAQEDEVVGAIDRAYQQIQDANSIVTGHLSSVVKVHEVQNEVLAAIGVDRDLRADVGKRLALASDGISGIVDTAATFEGSLSEVEEDGQRIKGLIEGIGE